MLSLFSALVPETSLYKPKILVDSAASKLHYRLTFSFLMVGCLIISATQFAGDPIKCLSEIDPEDDPHRALTMETYCWVATTFTLPEAIDTGDAKDNYFFIGPDIPGKRKYHAYYQWVPFVLFLQALTFYVPHYLWKSWEGERLKIILTELYTKLLPFDKIDKDVRELAVFFHRNLGHNGLWMIKYLFCEVLAGVVIVMNIYLTNVFLNYEFTTLGINLFNQINKDYENRDDSLVRVFPRVTKCTWKDYGPSGTVQTKDLYCILGWNNVNEKIYVFLWFWFLLVALTTLIRLLYFIMTLIHPKIRAKLFLKDNFRYFKSENFESVMKKLEYSDWLLLDQIQMNLSPEVFGRLIDCIADRIPFNKYYLITENELDKHS